MDLLTKASCKRYLASLGSNPALTVRQQVLTGLKRLAFSRVNDAVRLLLSDDPSAVDSLDLFPVSAVKRDKNGSIELRFYDRQKALEQLLVCSSADDSQAAAEAMLSALTGGEEAEHDTASDGRTVLTEAENSDQLVDAE